MSTSSDEGEVRDYGGISDSGESKVSEDRIESGEGASSSNPNSKEEVGDPREGVFLLAIPNLCFLRLNLRRFGVG